MSGDCSPMPEDKPCRQAIMPSFPCPCPLFSAVLVATSTSEAMNASNPVTYMYFTGVFEKMSGGVRLKLTFRSITGVALCCSCLADAQVPLHKC